jgi:hypothetical protein
MPPKCRDKTSRLAILVNGGASVLLSLCWALLRSVARGLYEIELSEACNLEGTGVPGLQPGHATQRVSSFDDID